MSQSKYYHYFVEGEDEEKLIQVLKTEMRLIVAGKVQKFNVVEQRLTRLRLMTLKEGTTVILVFDTDTGKADILKENIDFLKRENGIEDVLCVTQVKNLEDELKRSCNIKQIKELTGSQSNKEFKHDFIRDSAVGQKLLRHGFDFSKFWNLSATGEYSSIRNDAGKIKKKAK